jgi:GTP-sensing pleiotropic transcriptional regulator CodY
VEEEYLKYYSQLAVLVKDVPQLCIVAILQSSRESWSSVVVYSMVTSTLSVLFAMTVTLTSALMFWSGRSHAEREESERQLQNISDRTLLAEDVVLAEDVDECKAKSESQSSDDTKKSSTRIVHATSL